MSLFDIFRKKENIYYRDFKKKIDKVLKEEKVTITSLRIRVMTIEKSLNSMNKESEVEIIDKILKISVIEKLLNEAKKDFIEGVSIKLKEIGEYSIPSNYEICNSFCLSIEKKLWHSRKIALEEIRGFNGS